MILQKRVDSQIVHKGRILVLIKDSTGSDQDNSKEPDVDPEKCNLTERQKRLLLTILERNGLEPIVVEDLSREIHGRSMADLEKMEVSVVIGEVLDRWGKHPKNAKGKEGGPMISMLTVPARWWIRFPALPSVYSQGEPRDYDRIAASGRFLSLAEGGLRVRSLFDRSRSHMGCGTGCHGQGQAREGRESKMSMIAIAVTLQGIGAAVGSTVTSTPVVQQVPQPIMREAASSISPFLIVAIIPLVCACGYFVWASRRER